MLDRWFRVPQPLTLPPLDPEVAEELLRRFNQTTDAEARLRYQMVLLAHQGYTVPQIAPLVQRSHDTVTRVLQRFLASGLAAVPRRTPPGRERQVSPAWEAELVRVIELDPHEVGVTSANWTTGLLADYLAGQTGIRVDPETVRTYLHAHGYVCKRPTWTLKRRAQEQPDYPGNV